MQDFQISIASSIDWNESSKHFHNYIYFGSITNDQWDRCDEINCRTAKATAIGGHQLAIVNLLQLWL